MNDTLEEIVRVGLNDIVAEPDGLGDATIKSTHASTPVSTIDSSLFHKIVIILPVEYIMLFLGII
jgi:hypothetical protein